MLGICPPLKSSRVSQGLQARLYSHSLHLGDRMSFLSEVEVLLALKMNQLVKQQSPYLVYLEYLALEILNLTAPP